MEAFLDIIRQETGFKLDKVSEEESDQIFVIDYIPPGHLERAIIKFTRSHPFHTVIQAYNQYDVYSERPLTPQTKVVISNLIKKV